MLDDCIARVKELIGRREEIDAELSALLNVEPRQLSSFMASLHS